MTSTAGNGNVIEHRLKELERDVEKIEGVADTAAAKVALHHEQISGDRGLQKAIEELKDELTALRRSMYAVATAVVGGAVLMVLQQGGHL